MKRVKNTASPARHHNSANDQAIVSERTDFIHVITGSAKYGYGNQELTLCAGDSFGIDAELTYGFTEILTPKLVFVSVQAETRR